MAPASATNLTSEQRNKALELLHALVFASEAETTPRRPIAPEPGPGPGGKVIAMRLAS